MGGCIRRSGKVQSPRDMPAAGALLCFSEAESGGFLLGNKAGGASTNGGVGKVSGVIIGVLVFEVLKICLQFMGVGPAQTFIVQGFVIIVGVALDLRKYLAKK